MELSKRLQAVADMVSKGNTVADVGCDHGYVSIYLVESGIAPHVIAMDVNVGPLERAKEHITEHNLLSYIDTRLSNGLRNLEKNEADSLICAGMGGRLITQILQDEKEKIANMKELILQPQSEIHLVRGFVRMMNFVIVQEDMVYEDGKYYPILRAVPENTENISQKTVENCLDKKQLQDIFDEYGEYLIAGKHPVLADYLCFQKTKIEKLIHDLTNTNVSTEKQKVRLIELQKELMKIREVQKLMQSC